jgi:5'-deoxynucleotidase YfbR-like HD superfamily hydrolase
MKDLEFMWAGGYTDRYHTHRTLLRDTVGHHSYNVVCIIMHLEPKASAALLRAAILHDVAEHVLGDMPGPAKRAMPDYIADGERRFSDATFREVFGDAEEAAMASAGVSYPDLTPHEGWLLKMGDAIDGMRFCTQERAMGNKVITEIYNTYVRYVSELLSDARDGDRAVSLFNYMKEKWNDAVS